MAAADRRRPGAGTSAHRRGERGSMSVELVLLAPVFVGIMLLVVAGGRYVSVQGDIEAAARDAVRSASYERDATSALAMARRTAESSTDADCAPAGLQGPFVEGGTITVVLDCEISFDGLGLIGFPGTMSIDASSSAPLDFYRRTG